MASRNWRNMGLIESVSYSNNILNNNIEKKCYIGRGFYPTDIPSFLVSHILENPKWYTAYTPYQAEISQGRLESLFNFQTMISDITNLDISNASLLDEATAINEAMFMLFSFNKFKKNIFVIDNNLHPQNLSVVLEKSKHLNYQIEFLDNYNNIDYRNVCGLIIQNPDTKGNLLKNGQSKYELIKQYQNEEIPVVEVSDLFSCSIFTPPGENNFDISVGSAQRFGLPMWFGGPHAGFIAAKQKYLRHMPGRIVGKSIDSQNNESFRLTLQTREQHIRKDKATSNICTAQALLANYSTFYALYHGSQGIQNIAKKIHYNTRLLANNLSKKYEINQDYFDTISFNGYLDTNKFEYQHNDKNKLSTIAMNQLVTQDDLKEICNIAQVDFNKDISKEVEITRKTPLLQHTIFNKYNNENSLTRYIFDLADRDYSLVNGMIPLGSCTMKLNPVNTMSQLTNPKLDLHPYTNKKNAKGYLEMIDDLNKKLQIITGMDYFSFQLNSGSQGEYAGLIAIKKYLNDDKKNVIIIPDSAHGTNFASAKLAGYKIQTLKTHNGEIRISDLKYILENNSVAALMITYPSTYGIYDDNIEEIIKVVHQYSAQVYMDGANMNAQLGLTGPGYIGADVCHLNLHKTFAIPHGGGGPGVGPIGVKKHLIKHLPDIDYPNFSASPYGSASILSISWIYLLNNNLDNLQNIGLNSIKNANYLMNNLKDDFNIVYTKNDHVAHEFIIDCSEFVKYKITELDIAKRLLDYNFHAPTLSWPIKNSLMIEPTETENKEELDRFIKAMKSIKEEIINNPEILKNSPHSLSLLKDDWTKSYTTKNAFYPDNIDKQYFPFRNRVNDIYGDRNIVVKYD